MLNHGAFTAFAAPDLPAPEAPFVWISAIGGTVVRVEADQREAWAQRDFDITNLLFAVHVHFDADGIQHSVLKSPTFHVTCLVSGSLVTASAVRLRFTTDGLENLNPHLDALGVLAHVLVGRRLSTASALLGPVDRVRLRNAIIAVDGERAGASRREIATVIYGAAVVANEWSDPNGRLKAVVKRDVLRGRYLIAEGWRELVAGSRLR